MTLREKIAEQFDNCMGFHEGIKVPDYREGERAIDYADRIIELFTKLIDEKIDEYPNRVCKGKPIVNMYSELELAYEVVNLLKELKQEILEGEKKEK